MIRKIIKISLIFLLIAITVIVLIAWEVAKPMTEETCKMYLYQAIGSSLHPTVCASQFYFPMTENTSESPKVCVFPVKPKPGYEDRCETAKMVIDRMSGEIWVLTASSLKK